MALIAQPNLDYTDRDFDSIRARLVILIRSVFPDWTDFNVATFGTILMELHAHAHDVLGFYQDAQARETRWGTATQRASLLALVKLIGFEPDTATAATVDVTITARDASTGSSPIGEVVIPAGTLVKTPDVTAPVEFRTLAEVVIAAGANPPTVSVSVENADPQADQFTSSEQPNQEFKLGSVPYLDGSAAIVAADGTYTEVDSFLNSTATSRHFTVVVNQNDRATIRFGNGTSGKIPNGAIAVTYKTGGGVVVVGPGSVSVIPGAFADEFGNSLAMSVTNPLAASGGQARQSTAQIREAAPESLTVLNRSIARVDYEIVAKAVPGVARALMLTSDQDPSVPENTGMLYIIPEGGGLPSTALKNLVAAEFDELTGSFPSHLTFTLLVQDPDYLTIDVLATVFLSSGAVEATTAAAIRTNLTNFFAPTVLDDEGNEIKNPVVGFGFDFKGADGTPSGEIALSDVFNVVRDTTGVRKIGDRTTDFQLNLLHEDVPIERREFPRLGTVTLINGDTSQSI